MPGEGLCPFRFIFPALDPDNTATVSKRILTGLLREEMGFEGVIATDSMTMGTLWKNNAGGGEEVEAGNAAK